ncbi:hypothetical protein KCP78_00170 [Salmonella enterica subsp. enterica]|nr:hypothetical protein KCP78_00170 [Salmonella enterica subsp. enterica]
MAATVPAPPVVSNVTARYVALRFSLLCPKGSRRRQCAAGQIDWPLKCRE